ncbi:protein-tyrosine phosphatase-like protein [Pilobolus umbonatus]|nr:protein-tyrosine phosphatase-like protein [Pilobolus umbonatus]
MIMSRNSSPLGRMLTVIDCPNSFLRFLILDCPTESTLDFYMEEFMRLNVVAVVRCCQPTYSANRLIERNIEVIDLPFKDGGVPPPLVVREWLQLVEKNRLLAETSREEDPDITPPTIAVHCVAGLGRAPALVAIALIEMGMKPLDTIEYIRGKRRGAFNKPQIAYLDSYKRTLKTKSSASNYSLRFSLGRMFKLGSANKASPSPTPTPPTAGTLSQQT